MDRIIVILIGFFVVISLFYVLSPNGSGNIATEDLLRGMHAPIKVNNDTDFAAQAASEGWSGDGSASNPYVIENYEIDVQGGTSGIRIENVISHFVVRNCTIYNSSSSGILLNYVSNGTIFNNTMHDIVSDGLAMWSVSDSLLANNTIYNVGYYGFSVWFSDNNMISGNYVYDIDGIGIYTIYSDNNVMAHNNLVDNALIAIQLNGANNKLYANAMVNSGLDIYGSLYTSSSHTIPMNNTVNGKPVYYYKNSMLGGGGSVPIDAGEVIVVNATALVIEDIDFSHRGSVDIEIVYSSYITVRNCVIGNNSMEGMYIGDSNNITVMKNIIRENDRYGIMMMSSVDNAFYNNTMVNNSIFLYGNMRESSAHEIPMNNTVNGRPVYYYKNSILGGGGVPLDAGEVIVVNATDLVIEDIDFSHRGSMDIEIAYSSYITVRNCTVGNNSMNGIYMYYSEHNNILNNTIEDNGMDGIYAYYSDYNVFRTNSIINNGDYGIELSDSMYNLIYNNSFWYNHGSGDVYDSSHIQAYDNYINQWNTTTGYGNYWNDWTSPDDNGDGIVDDPYVVNLYSGYKDYYPRTTPSPGTDVPIPELSWAFLVVLLGAIVVILRRRH